MDDPQGQTTEYKVTKRSTEILGETFDEGAIGYSEFSRIACVNKRSIQYAVPSLYAMRTLLRYKPTAGSEIIDGVIGKSFSTLVRPMVTPKDTRISYQPTHNFESCPFLDSMFE